jgi:hypothetical protein
MYDRLMSESEADIMTLNCIRFDTVVDTNVALYTANVIAKQRIYNVKENNVIFRYGDSILSTLDYDVDSTNYFYFTHKYPDEWSITQTPLFMPTYADEIIDEEVEDYNVHYTIDYTVSMITGLKSKVNPSTNMIVNDQDTNDLVAFYKH